MLVTKNLSQTLTKIILTTTLAITGIIIGIIPEISDNFSRVSWNYQALAQNITNQEINQYARAVLDIESLRIQAFQDIGKIMGTQINSDITCNQPQSLNSLNQDARSIAMNYCEASKRIVENTGLTPSKFNQITNNARSNQNLQKRIQDAMIQIRSK